MLRICVNLALPRRRQHTCFAYVLIPLQYKTQAQPTDKIKDMLSIPSAYLLHPRPPCTFSGRAGLRARIYSASSCDMFARVVYVRLWGVQNCRLLLCHLPAHTCHALLPATNSCTPWELTNARSALVGVAETGQGSEGGRRESSLLTFGTFGHAKVR